MVSEDSEDALEIEERQKEQYKYRNGRPAENIFKEIHHEEAQRDKTYDHLWDKETEEFKSRVREMYREEHKDNIRDAMQLKLIENEKKAVRDDIKANEKYLSQD